MRKMIVFLSILLALTMILVSCAQPSQEVPTIPEPSEGKTEEGEGTVVVEEPTETPTPAETPLPIIEVEWETGGPYGEIHPLSIGIEGFDFGDREGNIVYALEYGTLWKTENGGKTWANILKGPIEAVFLIDPIDSNVMYVSKRRWADGHGSGFLKSVDEGNTWIEVDTPLGLHIEAIGPKGELWGAKRLQVDEEWWTKPIQIFKSQDGGETWLKIFDLFWKWKTTPEGRFKSLDGETWFKTDEIDGFGEMDDLYLRSITCDPRSEKVIYLGIEVASRKLVEDELMTGKRSWAPLVQLLKTTDGGESWKALPPLVHLCPNSGESQERITFRLPYDPRLTPPEPYAHRLGVSFTADPNNRDNLMAYVLHPPHPLPKPEELPPNWKDFVYHEEEIRKLFLSFDGGKSWREISLPPGLKERNIGKIAGKFALISAGNSLKLFLEELPGSERGHSQIWVSNLSIASLPE